MAEAEFWAADRREILHLAAMRMARLGRARDTEECVAEVSNGGRP